MMNKPENVVKILSSPIIVRVTSYICDPKAAFTE